MYSVSMEHVTMVLMEEPLRLGIPSVAVLGHERDTAGTGIVV